MILEDIRAEVSARGYHYVEQVRVDLWINQAYRDVCSRQPWPFLETDITGTSPFLIEDLREILFVSSGTTVLKGTDVRNLRDSDPELSATGDPVNWWLDGNTLHTYPEGADVFIRYIKRPAELGSGDEPLIPEEYQEVLVDGAVVRGLKDNDEYDTAQALAGVVDGVVASMVDQLLSRNLQNPGSIIQTGGAEDYIS